jgi:patatin-related protein
MGAASVTNPAELDPPAFIPEQEIRYALVLYGGVSLAIYINGVVQEFFRLVRATAPEWPLATDVGRHRAWFPLQAGGRAGVPPLRNSERVYRRLGQMLPVGAKAVTDSPIRTRFVVDILSGTSAGGINAIYLAKALANQQSIDALRDLWVKEGDIAVLLNDKRSYKDLSPGLQPQSPPRSLLNGYRLFVRALEALRGMEGTEQLPETDVSPSYAEQVDLAVTATDLKGLRMPIKLYDGVVQEKRHKNVFRFAYSTKEATGTERNDFGPENNAMLAFAARCTSSFPFAFEPMVLDDLADVLPSAQYSHEGQPWRQFFRDYVRMGAEDYRSYAFADGGYLDNKPFTHATDQLGRRRADVPVERKLIYIEPDPSGDLAPDTPAAAAEDRPDVFENVAAAVTKLPRTETIREDVDAVVRRSRTVARLRAVTGKVIDAAATSVVMGGAEVSTLPAESESLAYTELRRQNVLDDLADVVARVVGIPDESDGQHALRLVASAWADLRAIENDELFALYDLGFKLRRLTFVQHRINDLIAEVGGPTEVASDLGIWSMTAETATRLRQVKLALNEIFVELRWRGRGVRYPQRTAEVLEADRIAHGPEAVPVDPDRFRAVADAVAATGLTEEALVARVLDPGNGLVRSEDQARARAAEFARRLGPRLDALANTLAEIFDLPFRSEHAAAMLVLGGKVTEDAEAQEEARKWLLRPGEPESDAPRLLDGLDEVSERLRNLLRWYYEAFDQIDALLLPLTYPDLVEVNPVDVIRISPLDAKSLIDETGETRRKLSGASVHHFGGFFDEGFRVNDILWGRLDGAERIIETVLPPGHELKGFFVEAAQLGIIGEDLLGESRPTWVAEAIRKHSPASPRSGGKTAELLELLGEGWTDERLAEALAVREHLATRFTAPTEKNRRKMLDVIGRGTSITSDVVGAEADRSQSALKPIFWVGRLGRIVAGLAALATRPRAAELPRIVFRNVAVIALALGFLLIILDVLGVDGVAKAGWTIAIVTAIAQLAVWLTTAWVGAEPRHPGARSRKRFLRGVIGTIVALMVVLAAIGAFHVVDRIVDRVG